MAHFTVHFTGKAEKGISVMAERLGIKKKDVVRKALALLDFVSREQEKGGILTVEIPSTRQEIITL